MILIAGLISVNTWRKAPQGTADRFESATMGTAMKSLSPAVIAAAVAARSPQKS
jgi:hypothetical protein